MCRRFAVTWRRRGCTPGGLLAAAILLVALHAGGAAAAGDNPRRHIGSGAEATAPSKPPLEETKAPNPSHVAHEGGMERPLWIDTGRVAEFPPAGGSGKPAIRPAAPGELSDRSRVTKPGERTDNPGEKTTGAMSDATSDATPAGVAGAAVVSPLFIDASGRPRALPGGVIVSLKEVLRDAQAREQLQAAGLTPVRQIGERMWLVESPAGLASLELANRLHATGRFEFVQPNWWQPRTTK